MTSASSSGRRFFCSTGLRRSESPSETGYCFGSRKVSEKSVRPIEDQFYGDRLGMVEDPFGYRWSIATHIEDLSPEEMEARAREAGKGCGD